MTKQSGAVYDKTHEMAQIAVLCVFWEGYVSGGIAELVYQVYT